MWDSRCPQGRGRIKLQRGDSPRATIEFGRRHAKQYWEYSWNNQNIN